MKNFIGTMLKVLAALATIAGAVYIAATYGDTIVAWAKKLLNKFRCNDFICCCDEDCCCGDEDCCCEEASATQADETDFVG